MLYCDYLARGINCPGLYMTRQFQPWRPLPRITPVSSDKLLPLTYSRLLRDKLVQGCPESEPAPRCSPPSLLATNSPGKTSTPGPDCLDRVECSRGY